MDDSSNNLKLELAQECANSRALYSLSKITEWERLFLRAVSDCPSAELFEYEEAFKSCNLLYRDLVYEFQILEKENNRLRFQQSEDLTPQ